MLAFTPSLDHGEARRTLETLVAPHRTPLLFNNRIERLGRMHSVFLAWSAPPWHAPGLCLSPEINYRSEQWLPLDDVGPHFIHFYRESLTYSPLLSSTPFADSPSWAAIVSGFPPFLKDYCNPARLLSQLASDAELREKFLFWSFMPGRFYGAGPERYPLQTEMVREWVRGKSGLLRCLDAASGDGSGTYGVARLLLEQGWDPARFRIEGWTLEPLEAWAAAHAAFPHDPAHERAIRDWVQPVFEVEAQRSVTFRISDLCMNAPLQERTGGGMEFDLILCNGLLGGPIVSRPDQMRRIVFYLVGLLAPGGLLLAADHFHGGWKQKCPQQELRALFETSGLTVIESREGVAGLAPPQAH